MRNVGKKYISTKIMSNERREGGVCLERTSKTKESREKDWKTLFIVKRRIPNSPIASQNSQNGLAFIFMVGDASHLGGWGASDYESPLPLCLV